ncbi:hypothetical protein LTR47_000684 [Exophiala xenobiotica]|nr:hypothetical protein LTR41_006903 [Exophiala xenobiotica]KAK5227987.1 hypothetical protein LTR72_001870 [Exophiala xenobiotica]KAK5238941.1 hypothetical protein LTR47_000684 [Exophiala xenobiotica]KAK5255863.1 hypothetical protein LTS06_000319 [Exophiala xenobiotica]KAK5302578.1 hypothetical protein LTR14_000827 [Exophiala xenobiotica]
MSAMLDASSSYDSLDSALFPCDMSYQNDYVGFELSLTPFNSHIDGLIDYPDVEHGKLMSHQTKDTIVRTNDFDCAEMLESTSSGIPSSSSSISEDRSGESAKLRRRAQNRASQRAFRERKEKHIKGLTRQFEALSAAHNTLRKSYAQQRNVLVRLQAHIAELDAEIRAMHASREATNMTVGGQAFGWNTFGTFDAFTFTTSTPICSSSQAIPQDTERQLGSMYTNDPFMSLAEDWPGSEDLLSLQ